MVRGERVRLVNLFILFIFLSLIMSPFLSFSQKRPEKKLNWAFIVRNTRGVSGKIKHEVKEEEEVKAEDVPDLKLACDVEKKFEACKKLYWYYAKTGSEERNKYFKALFELKKKDYFLKTCNEKDAESCFLLGRAYGEGVGVPEDYGKAVSFYKKAWRWMS